jgi:hypothetical protein
MIDPEDEAYGKHLRIPPALLEEIAGGSEDALAGAARVQLAYIMEQITLRCVDKNTSPSAVASVMEVLRKMSTSQKEAAASGGPGVVINITRAKDREDAGITIEAKKDEGGGYSAVPNLLEMSDL